MPTVSTSDCYGRRRLAEMSHARCWLRESNVSGWAPMGKFQPPRRGDRKVAMAADEQRRLLGVTWKGRFRYLFVGRTGTPGKALTQGDKQEKRLFFDSRPRYVGSGGALFIRGSHSNRKHGAENLPTD